MRQDDLCLWQLYGDKFYLPMCYKTFKTRTGLDLEHNESLSFSIAVKDVERLGFVDLVLHQRDK